MGTRSHFCKETMPRRCKWHCYRLLGCGTGDDIVGKKGNRLFFLFSGSCIYCEQFCNDDSLIPWRFECRGEPLVLVVNRRKSGSEVDPLGGGRKIVPLSQGTRIEPERELSKATRLRKHFNEVVYQVRTRMFAAMGANSHQSDSTAPPFPSQNDPAGRRVPEGDETPPPRYREIANDRDARHRQHPAAKL